MDGSSAGCPADETLIQSWLAGERDAFDALYRRYRLTLFRFIVGQCTDVRLAEELFQDVWSRVVTSIRSGHGPATFRPWLYRITRNRLADHYRQAARGPVRVVEDAADAIDCTDDSEADRAALGLQRPLQPDELALLAERRDSLDTALQTLPEAQREVLLLKHVAGMTLGEIAEALDLKPETAKSRLRYAMNQLRERLREPL